MPPLMELPRIGKRVTTTSGSRMPAAQLYVRRRNLRNPNPEWENKGRREPVRVVHFDGPNVRAISERLNYD